MLIEDCISEPYGHETPAIALWAHWRQTHLQAVPLHVNGATGKGIKAS